MVIKEGLIEGLKRAVGRKYVLTDPTDLVAYGRDASIFRGMPSAVVFPKTTEEVADVLRLAYHFETPVVPRGAGTGLVGGAVPTREESVILSSKCINGLLDIELSSRTVLVESGMILGKLNSYLSKYGFYVPPEPDSNNICTVGGNISTDAHGLGGLRHGSFRHRVLNLEVVTSEGEIHTLGGMNLKHASGYNLINFFVGGEGTLGFITNLTLRTEAIPRARGIVSAFFKDPKSAVQSAQDMMLTGLEPNTLEFMDMVSLEAALLRISVEGFPGPNLLLVGFEGQTRVEVTTQSKRAIGIMKNLGGEGRILEWDHRVWDLRKNCLPALLGSKKGAYYFDLSVPMGRIVRALDKIYSYGRDVGANTAIYGRIGEGIIHPVFSFDRGSNDPPRFEEIQDALASIVLDLGGTLSGEYGIGIAKKPFFHLEQSNENVELMKRWRDFIDPKGLMNPDKIWKV